MKFAIHPLTLGTLVLVAALGSAHATTLATANASLSNIKITLVDLDPNDGIAPSVTFGSGFLGLYGDQIASASAYVGSSPGTLFGATASGAQNGLSYNLSPSSINIGASVDSSDISQAAPLDYSDYYYAGAGKSLDFASAPAVDFNSGDHNYNRISKFTLSANTGLLITGTASASVTAVSNGDVKTAVAGSFDPTVVDLSGMNAAAYASSSISFILASPSILTEDSHMWDVPNSSISTVNRAVDSYIGNEDEAVDFQDSSSFVLTFANGSAESAEGVLALIMQAGTSASAYAPALYPTEVPTTIPEPSTYLLMGLGLAGIGLACSRQRAKQAAEA